MTNTGLPVTSQDQISTIHKMESLPTLILTFKKTKSNQQHIMVPEWVGQSSQFSDLVKTLCSLIFKPNLMIIR